VRLEVHIRPMRKNKNGSARSGDSGAAAAGAAIEGRSMEIIEAEIPEPRPFQGREWLVVRRMIHATADFELLELAEFSAGAVEAGIAALKSGCTVFADTRMCAAGLVQRRFDPLGCKVVCRVDSPQAAEAADANGTTRAAAAVDIAAELDRPGVWVIGNAPTALIRLMELARSGRAEPKLIIGMPVGFVSSAESKAELASTAPAPFLTIRGRKGGSPAAAAAANALAVMALEDESR
jgi:precorrin-8X/cobalt-precorrin-8 methylmutase